MNKLKSDHTESMLYELTNTVSTYLGQQMNSVFVTIPDPCVVAVGDLKPLDPVIPLSVTSTFGNDPSDQSGRSDIDLQPLAIWKSDVENQMG